MEREYHILSVGFEGSNRAGKSTQIELLSQKLESASIPYLIVRGDGSRPNEGNMPGDPMSDWWAEMLPRLRGDSATPHDWDVASYRLARELILFRDRVLPRIAAQSGSDCAWLLVDRSVLSRAMVPAELGLEPVADYLYPNKARTGHSMVNVDAVCPDVIFNLIANQEVLLSRLDKTDPKYEFRRKLIDQKCDWYKGAERFIPEHLRDRVVEIDASKTPADVHAQICTVLNHRYSGTGVDL